MATKASKMRQKTRKPDKYRKLKIALIPVLLCVLAYVVISQTMDSKPNTGAQVPGRQPPATAQRSPGTNRPTPPRRLGQPSAKSLPVAAQSQLKTKPWPEVELTFLDSDSLFERYQRTAQDLGQTVDSEPTTPAVPEESFSSQMQRVLTEKPIQYVFESDTRQYLLMDQDVLQEGDAVSDVAEINEIGVGKLIFTRRPPTPKNDQVPPNEQ